MSAWSRREFLRGSLVAGTGLAAGIGFPKILIYTGATINQQATPSVDYLMSPEGGGKKKFYLLGSDYVYPRTTNKILRLYLTKVKKVPESAIAEEYTPFHHQDYQTIVGKIKSFSAAGDAEIGRAHV